jgi:uncharacterized integral membrane protein (TIGR00698 family)
MDISGTIRRNLPGFLFCVILAFLTLQFEAWLKGFGEGSFPYKLVKTYHINWVIIGIFGGIVIRNVLGKNFPGFLVPGIGNWARPIIKPGIILMGATLTFNKLIIIGFKGIVIVLVCLTVVFSVTILLGNKLNIPKKFTYLLAMGNGVCGVSAVIATTPVVRAKPEESIYAISCILMYGVIALILYPILGYSFHIPDGVYGAWAGTSVHNTAQAIAVGAMYTPLNDQSAEVSAAIKLARNSLLPFLVVALGFVMARDMRRETAVKIPYLKIIAEYFPVFVLGFFGLAIWNTVSPFSKEQLVFIKKWWMYLTLTGFIGVGLLTDLKVFRAIGGYKPFVVFSVACVILMTVSYSLAYFLF